MKWNNKMVIKTPCDLTWLKSSEKTLRMECIWTQSVSKGRTWETFNYLLRKRRGRRRRRWSPGQVADSRRGESSGSGRWEEGGINWRRDSRRRRHLRVYSLPFAAVNAPPCLRGEGAHRRKQLISVPTLLTCFLRMGYFSHSAYSKLSCTLYVWKSVGVF